jgi:hypothetical protein
MVVLHEISQQFGSDVCILDGTGNQMSEFKIQAANYHLSINVPCRQKQRQLQVQRMISYSLVDLLQHFTVHCSSQR